MELEFIQYYKNLKGEYKKIKTKVSSHYCTYADFFNKYNDSFDYLKANTFQCLDDYGDNLEDIFSDPLFTYYELSVISKDATEENLNKIDDYLFRNDCKLQIIFTDLIIDINNYKQPITSFLNEVFIQLSPTLYIKRNMFFMNQYLTDDDLIFGVFAELKRIQGMKNIHYIRD